MKIANHYDKQLTPSKSWDQDNFFEPGFGVSSNSNHRARIFTTPWHSNQGEYLDSLIYIYFSLSFFYGFLLFWLFLVISSRPGNLKGGSKSLKKIQLIFFIFCNSPNLFVLVESLHSTPSQNPVSGITTRGFLIHNVY